ncbi:hypothetical protein OEZ85_007791 [Tetradesmus obliquus]|uniref:Uncharacterized protein n=1 Tax=Tetradesmus obliquus TaxID=3088 RepID=A0ABY8TH03_TETOB|nr:hypothetical protein OEZ85_007791 [Tetradesmus obliquus]
MLVCCLQAMFVYFACGWLTGDPFHMLIPPLRLGLLLVLVGFIPERFFELASLRYWPMAGQYIYLGWTAFMLALPLRLHLASSLAEWLLIASTALRVNSVYHGIPPASATSLQQLLASALFVLETAAAVLAAAEAAAGSACGPRPGAMPHYTSLAASMPVSVKVHTSHSNVGVLSPLLGSTLAAQLSPFSSAAAPLQLATACFPGCVQLLGNIIAVKAAAARPGAAAAAGVGGGSAGWCRLLAFNSSGVLLDETAQLQEALRVALPAQAAGLCHIALLPGLKPDTTTAPSSSNIEQLQQQYAGSEKFAAYQAAAAAAWLGGWSIRLVWSVVVVFLLHIGPSLAVAWLRLRTHLKLQRVRKQQQPTASPAATCSPQAQRNPKAGGTTEHTAAAVFGAAGFARQRLLALCVVSVSLLNLLCASGGVIAPIMIVRAWGLHSWAQDAAMTLVLVVKAWMYQVPFHWFVPLMATEVATHAYGSYVFDLQPRYWLAVRYLTGLAIAMAVAAAHNALARKQFCSHGSRRKAKVA